MPEGKLQSLPDRDIVRAAAPIQRTFLRDWADKKKQRNRASNRGCAEHIGAGQPEAGDSQPAYHWADKCADLVTENLEAEGVLQIAGGDQVREQGLAGRQLEGGDDCLSPDHQIDDRQVGCSPKGEESQDRSRYAQDCLGDHHNQPPVCHVGGKTGEQ